MPAWASLNQRRFDEIEPEIAKALHRARFNNGAPFVPVNCGAVPEHLLESEFFGHERGAFSGAIAVAASRHQTESQEQKQGSARSHTTRFLSASSIKRPRIHSSYMRWKTY